MLDATTYRLPSTTVKQPPAPLINGPGRQAFKHLTKSQRAALAVAVIRGDAGLLPTLGVVSKALGVSIPYIEAAARLSPEQLRQLRRGELTISETKSAPETLKPQTTLADVMTWWRTADAAEHAAVVGSVGVVTPWHAIEANLD
jgi:hypothetical protein